MTDLLQDDLGGCPGLVLVSAPQEAAGQLGRHLQVGGDQGLGCGEPGVSSVDKHGHTET